MWIDGLKNAVAYATFDGHHKPRRKLEQSLVYPEMTAGVCWPALSSSLMTDPFPIPYPFEQEGGITQKYIFPNKLSRNVICHFF